VRNKVLLVGILLLGFTRIGIAQNAVPTSKFGWDMQGSSLAEVSAFVYKYYADGATMGVQFPTTVICNGTVSPYQCVVNIPAFTAGNHSVTVTASSAGGESAKSAPLAFTFISVPVAPTSLKLIP
jgi:hypothetical protein